MFQKVGAVTVSIFVQDLVLKNTYFFLKGAVVMVLSFVWDLACKSPIGFQKT